jgi:integrase
VSDKQLERLLKQAGAKIGMDLSPHCLRASFITLTSEGGARLEQVQYAARHADPRTTQRYRKRKVNLDDNAVDYLKL